MILVMPPVVKPHVALVAVQSSNTNSSPIANLHAPRRRDRVRVEGSTHASQPRIFGPARCIKTHSPPNPQILYDMLCSFS